MNVNVKPTEAAVKTEEQFYLSSLTDKYQKGHEIAMRTLDGSYSVVKSIGFIEWKKKMEESINHSSSSS
jgi:hypothetical protein